MILAVFKTKDFKVAKEEVIANDNVETIFKLTAIDDQGNRVVMHMTPEVWEKLGDMS